MSSAATWVSDMRAALGRGGAHHVRAQCLQRLRSHPNDADSLFLLGLALERIGAREAGLEALAAAAQLQPDGERLAQVSRAHCQLRQDEQALRCADAAFEAGVTSALDADTIGNVYTRLGHHERAVPLFEKATELDPENPQFQFNLACALHFTGRPGAAEAHERVIALDPTFARAHLALAGLQLPQDGAARVARIERTFPLVRDPVSELQLHCAAAKELERAGDHQRAFFHLQSGKSRHRQRIGYDFEADRRTFDTLRSVFADPGFFVGKGCASASPIFVIGMPRSGTTLVERMLSSHPALVSAGELLSMPLAVKKLSRATGRAALDPTTVVGMATVAPESVGQAYLSNAGVRFAHATRFIDKFPMNFLYAGFIARALPHSKIICLRREPMDLVWSNYKHLFAASARMFDYSYDPVDCARYVAKFERLIEFWHATMPGRILDVSYEQLIAEPEAQIARMLSYCELGTASECFSFFSNPSPVATPSAAQVRRPLYSSSIGAWKSYAAFLEPAAQQLSRDLANDRGSRPAVPASWLGKPVVDSNR